MEPNIVYLAALVVLLAIVWGADRKYPVLRDLHAGTVDSKKKSYSLGRVQMAFWTILLIAGLIKMAALKGWTTEILIFDHKILVLLGISGATGALAMAVDLKKDNDVATATATAAAAGQTATELQAAASQVGAQDASALVKLQSSAAAKIVEKDQAATAAKRAQRTGVTDGFFNDILEDDNGNSLHRLQMVLFTLLAGVLFVIGTLTIPDPNVVPALDLKLVTLPEIPEQILELLGIAGGVYVGFKIPGKAAT